MSNIQFSTTALFISNFKASFPVGTIVETLGYTTKGDGGGAKWQKTATTGQTVSQSPAQLGSALLNDGNGNQWAMQLTNTVSFDTFALLQASTSGNVGQELICRERSDATYIIQPSTYTALSGDVTLANGRVAKLQIKTTSNMGWFGLSSSNTEAQNVAAWDLCLGRYNLDNGRARRYNIEIPSGRFLVTNLVLASTYFETGITQGRLSIKGQGPINTEFVSSAATGDVLKVTTGKILLSDFSISSDGITRSATVGAGNGLVVDETDGATPAITTIAKFDFSNIDVQNQPDNGLYLVNIELLFCKNVTASANGNYGFWLYSDNYGGPKKGISNTFINTRAVNNVGDGYRIEQASECTFIDCQGLGNNGDYQFWSNGRNTKLINPDMEGKTGATVLFGILLAGELSSIVGGLVYGFYTGIKLTGDAQRVENVKFSNTALAYSMATAINTELATNYSISIESNDLTAVLVTQVFTPKATHDGGYQRIAGTVAVQSAAPALNSFEITSNATTAFGDNYGGSILSSTYNVLLSSNAVIAIPTTFIQNQEFTIIFLQDATGSRAVTFSGASWKTSWSNAGNVANSRSVIKFKVIADVHAGGTQVIQIGAQITYFV
jgi:hypothetical protein